MFLLHKSFHSTHTCTISSSLTLLVDLTIITTLLIAHTLTVVTSIALLGTTSTVLAFHVDKFPSNTKSINLRLSYPPNPTDVFEMRNMHMKVTDITIDIITFSVILPFSTITTLTIYDSTSIIEISSHASLLGAYSASFTGVIPPLTKPEFTLPTLTIPPSSLS